MADNIKRTFTKYKVLIYNYGYLSSLQLFTMLVPIVTLPFLLKVLGKEVYGLLVYAQAVVSYFVVVINLGFNVTATKDVSVFRDDKEKLSEIVSSVFIIKFFLFFLSLIVLHFVLFFIPGAEDNKLLFYLTMYMGLYEFIFPIWYFQGKEKMKFITMINLISRSIFLFLVFIVIRDEKDVLLVPIVNAIGAMVAGGISIWLVFFYDRVKFKFQPISVLTYYLKESLPLFGFNLAGVVKSRTNIIFLAVVSNYEMVTYYHLAEKISGVVSLLFNNFSTVLFPYIAKTKDILLGKKAFGLSLVMSVLAYVFSSALFYFVVVKLAPEYLISFKLYLILGIFIPIYASASFLGNSLLVSHGFKKQHFYSTLWPTFIYIGAAFILYVFGFMTVFSLAVLLLIAQLFSTLHKYYFCRKFGIL